MRSKIVFSQKILTIVQDEPLIVSTFYSRNQYDLQPYPLSERVVGLFKIEDALRILYTTDKDIREILRIKFKKDYGLGIYV
jgi:hypothetical protein